MKPFNLEEAKAGKKVCTRKGREAEIIKFDFNHMNKHVYKDYKLLVILKHKDGYDEIYLYNEKGENILGDEYDLFMASEKKTGWANVMKGESGNIVVVGMIYPTEAEAESNIDVLKQKFSVFEYIATAKIEWEE